MSSDTPRLSVTEKVGYGFGDLASNLFWQMFSIFIAKFYTDVFLLGAAAMGTMMLVTRIADAFIDPMIGTLAGRSRGRTSRLTTMRTTTVRATERSIETTSSKLPNLDRPV